MAKPILLIELNYELEKVQAELIETDIKVKLEFEYHVLILTNINNEKPYLIRQLQEVEGLNIDELKGYLQKTLIEADKALIKELRQRNSQLSESVKNLSGYIDSIGHRQGFIDYKEEKGIKTVKRKQAAQ